MRCAIATLVLGFSAANAAADTLTIIPSNPVQNQPVHVRVQSDGATLSRANFDFERSMVLNLSNDRLRLLASGPGNVPVEGDPVDYTFYPGRFPVGTFTLDLSHP